MTKTSIATFFSSGNFEETFPFLGENASWNVIEENQFDGKAAILKQCRDVAAYFKTVTTNFRVLQVIEGENKIAVSGTAEFLRNGKRISFIHGCDIYLFTDDGLLESITSYCIKSK
ncbi:nuclear transport factor 2 family protein [Flavihumibacter sp. UBA7668]|uniref:nuclear transport factor 2 family protein n=1 Tax=Flavihumibacter sp. UBA7668 TaxID=1946542 RepID=UPI0025BCE8B5|nr:nuclear transport factor 2 family protein [Flavihumibacter sp. UBA7668]